jgi:hypothetical protein
MENEMKVGWFGSQGVRQGQNVLSQHEFDEKSLREPDCHA